MSYTHAASELVRLFSCFSLLIHLQIENPVGRRPKGSTFSSHCQTVDLGRIQPRHSLESNTKEYIIEEEECYRRGRNFFGATVSSFLVVIEQDCDDEVAEELTSTCKYLQKSMMI
jgi:hypothetical protein